MIHKVKRHVQCLRVELSTWKKNQRLEEDLEAAQGAARPERHKVGVGVGWEVPADHSAGFP